MSEARSLVNIIDDLEKKSEELESVIDMYKEIKSLEDKIGDTAIKYDSLLKLIEDSDSKLKDSGKIIEKISTELSINLKKYSSGIDNIRRNNELMKVDIINLTEYISDIKKELVNQGQKNELLDKRIYDNQGIVEYNFKGINQSLSKLQYEVENDKEIILEIRQDIDRYNNSLIDKIETSIKDISENVDKKIKIQNILIIITIIASIINIFF